MLRKHAALPWRKTEFNSRWVVQKINGLWRSLVARLLWEQEVAGSIPASPTKKNNGWAGCWFLTVSHKDGHAGSIPAPVTMAPGREWQRSRLLTGSVGVRAPVELPKFVHRRNYSGVEK